ncbi:putative ABC transport system permease protein [Enterococcus sp. PF1-24]|uniref:ABC transporter permease n=1 Tax=unclassified Enterococcus TaxID=2608891 RepID=UPI002474B662|nr:MULTISPECIES: ABC transporter permease [unclassified Enterococcus]MDH6364857.1 putative ABC transport system permease protein [Enterococcus sp. PFB1-1]MDH6401919.1 putative ABC transport system permease protein [Enterococcus sp. PF1-24]
MKKKLWKDIRKSFTNSWGRFFSIVCLMALGSFALVGLNVTGPDMRATGADFFEENHLADLTVIGSLGIDAHDQSGLDQTHGLEKIEYGYLKDVVLKDSQTSFRIFSEVDEVSNYQVVKGHLPKKAEEIALDAEYQEKYKIGDEIEFTEKADVTGEKILKRHQFKIVGFVKSSEIISNVNLGPSTAGSGSLDGYGVVTEDVFDVDYYLVARMTFKDTQRVDPYSDDYNQLVQKHKADLDDTLTDLPAARLASIQAEYQKEIDDGQAKIADSQQQLADSQQQLADGQQKLNEAQQAITQAKAYFGETPEIQQQEAQYQAELTTFNQKKAEAEEKIAENTTKLNDAQETLDGLQEPVYSVNNRRETPGSEGYLIYSNVGNIIDSLAKVFPWFLYFVAALVTFTTMTRFVDEERTNSGTLKALGYEDRDIRKKFVVYGFISSFIGSVIGIVLGHTLLPLIVHSAYSPNFTLPEIQLHFYGGITLLALFLAILSAVVPAFIVATNELRKRPATLLLPKPPTAGAKILLERITPIWNRLSFTHKVTARNIFRYKKRMLMTIFGVCGSVALLFAGFSVQHSVSGISDRQFSEIIKYDLIVAEKDQPKAEESREIEDLLASDTVEKASPVRFEELTKVAGKEQDEQAIKVIVPDDQATFDDYVHLANRQTQKALPLNQEGVIISERLAKLLEVEVGDSITLKDQDNQSYEMEIAGIAEMYMNHFVFMDKETYQEIFGKDFATNGNLVILKNHSAKNVRNQATEFMQLNGIQGVVQNTTITSQIHTIVHSLDKIMGILIIVAALLAIVILYNLTNINVSERLRELSTIKVLGFFDREVTLYIYRETILLSLIGILVGFGVGEALHRYIIAVVPPNDVMFNPALATTSFGIPLLIISLVTVILGFVVNHRLKNIDMLEALKSVD